MTKTIQECIDEFVIYKDMGNYKQIKQLYEFSEDAEPGNERWEEIYRIALHIYWRMRQWDQDCTCKDSCKACADYATDVTWATGFS